MNASAVNILAGAGAQRILVTGNTSGATPTLQAVEYDMDGLTPVVTPESYQGFSVSEVRVIQSNDLERTDVPTGTITVTQGATTVAQVLPEQGVNHNGFRRVPFSPAGDTLTWTLGAGQVAVLDLAGQQNAAAQFTLWRKPIGQQIYSLGVLPLEAAVETRAPLLGLVSFVSGESFAARVACEVAGVKFFISAGINVFTEFAGAFQDAYLTRAR